MSGLYLATVVNVNIHNMQVHLRVHASNYMH